MKHSGEGIFHLIGLLTPLLAKRSQAWLGAVLHKTGGGFVESHRS